MSFAYMFKFIIIGDTGTVVSKFRCRQVMLVAAIHRSSIQTEARSNNRS